MRKKIVEKKTSYSQFYFLVTLMMTSFVNEAGGQQITNPIYFKSFTECFL